MQRALSREALTAPFSRSLQGGMEVSDLCTSTKKLLVTKGIATSNKKLLVAPGHPTSKKKLLVSQSVSHALWRVILRFF